MGGGAIAGALLLPKIRTKLSTNRMTFIASLMLALEGRFSATVAETPPEHHG